MTNWSQSVKDKTCDRHIGQKNGWNFFRLNFFCHNSIIKAFCDRPFRQKVGRNFFQLIIIWSKFRSANFLTKCQSITKLWRIGHNLNFDQRFPNQHIRSQFRLETTISVRISLKFGRKFGRKFGQNSILFRSETSKNSELV